MSKFKGKPIKSRETIQQVLSESEDNFDIPERGISKGTIKHFGIRRTFDQTRGEVHAYYFPVTKKGKLTGFVKCTPSLPKDNGRFTMVGEVEADRSDLLGQKQAKEGALKVFIVEGFWDTLAAFEAIRGQSKKKFPNLLPSVVSPALGIGNSNQKITNARRHLTTNIDFINTFKEVIVCFDNDLGETNVGQEGVKDCALLLKNFKNVLLPENDINDMLLNQGSYATNQALVWGASDYELDAVSTSISNIDEVMKPLKKGVNLESLPKTMGMMHGLREREFTILLAPPKCGKTTVCKLINYELLKQGHRTLGIYLEEDLVKTHQSMIALHAGVHLPLYRENPSQADPKLVTEAIEIINSDTSMFYNSDSSGKLSPSKVMSLLEWAAIKDVKYVILDHLSFVFSGDSKMDERKGIDNLLTDIATFVKASGIHVIAVAHIKRDTNKLKPKTKSGEIVYPYWYEVDETDGRGSGAFEQVCWNMWAIDKEITEDKSRGLTRLKVLYNREWDNTGITDYLTLNKSTGRLQAIEQENY